MRIKKSLWRIWRKFSERGWWAIVPDFTEWIKLTTLMKIFSSWQTLLIQRLWRSGKNDKFPTCNTWCISMEWLPEGFMIWANTMLFLGSPKWKTKNNPNWEIFQRLWAGLAQKNARKSSNKSFIPMILSIPIRHFSLELTIAHQELSSTFWSDCLPSHSIASIFKEANLILLTVYFVLWWARGKAQLRRYQMCGN